MPNKIVNNLCAHYSLYVCIEQINHQTFLINKSNRDSYMWHRSLYTVKFYGINGGLDISIVKQSTRHAVGNGN